MYINGTLATGFGGSLGSLAPDLIGIIIIPGSLVPPISTVSITSHLTLNYHAMI